MSDPAPPPLPLRPAALNPWFADLTALPGIGPTLAGRLERLLGGRRVLDLLFHLPVSAIDRRRRCSVAEAPPGSIATVSVDVLAHRPPPGRGSRAPFRVVTSDGTGDLVLAYFGLPTDRIERMLPLGSTRLVSGLVEVFDGIKQIVHPDHVLAPERAGALPLVEPVYPAAEGLGQRLVAGAVRHALAAVRDLPEWLSPDPGRPGFLKALRTRHEVSEPEALALDAAAARRLALDEVFAGQLALQLAKRRAQNLGRSTVAEGRLGAAIRQGLPFALTAAQEAAVAAILADMAAPRRMMRLLQGDVGSGKTVVALLALAAAQEAGRQGALMAPTELLARQHAATLERFGAPHGLRLAVLSGRDKGRRRQELIAAVASGAVSVVVGTHALVQDEVAFQDLALAVIDEQHRFGVAQRQSLAAKGAGVDLLLTSATPIPRTLVQTLYGDLDVSRLDEKPPGRQPIDTRVIPLTRLDEVEAAIGRLMAREDRIYWICPTVSETEDDAATAAEARYRQLLARFGDAVALVHGRMRAAEKDAALAGFAKGAKRILVATTVVEVGVDVPEATVMVIEHAERFGLAQLHQLRGRVGRGTRPSTCLLVWDPEAGDLARERLTVLRETDDGFLIAEADLTLRGPGEALGARQAGLPASRLVDWAAHHDLVAVAREEALSLVQGDPALRGVRGQAARLCLHLFGHAAALQSLEIAG